MNHDYKLDFLSCLGARVDKVSSIAVM